MPNKKKEFSGIYKYNIELVKLLKKKSNIKTIYTGKTQSYFITMLHKFIFIPFFLIVNSHKFHSVVYPEEGYAFLRIFSFSKKNNIIVHDYRKIFNIKYKVKTKEKVKQIYLDTNYLFFNKFSKIICPSNFTKNLIIKNLSIKSEKVCIIPNIVDFENKKPSNLKIFKKIKKSQKKFKNVMCVTSGETRKNLDSLYKIIRSNKNINFILVGNIKEKIFEKNAFFLTNISEENLIYLYKNSDFFLDVSLFEGFGRSLIEAQYFGLKVICMNTKSNKELLGKSATYINKNFKQSKIDYIFKKKLSKKQKKKFIKNANKFSSKNIYRNFKTEINEI